MAICQQECPCSPGSEGQCGNQQQLEHEWHLSCKDALTLPSHRTPLCLKQGAGEHACAMHHPLLLGNYTPGGDASLHTSTGTSYTTR